MWDGDAETFVEVVKGEREAELVELEVEVEVVGGLGGGGGLDADVGFAVGDVEEVVEDEAVDLAVEGFGDEGGVVFFEDGGFGLLEGGAGGMVFGEGGEVGAAPEGDDGAVHAVDEGWVGEFAAGGEVDGLDVGAAGHEGVEFGAEVADGVESGVPLWGARAGVGGGFYARHAVAFAVDEPVFEGEVFEEVGDGAGFHEAVAGGDEPLARGEGEGVVGGGGLEEAEFAGGVFEEPEGDEAEGGGEEFFIGGVWLVGDFVDGVFFCDGVEHLFDEEGEAAGEVVVAGVGGGEVVVEVLEGEFVLEGLWGVVEGEDFPFEAGDGFFAFGDDALEDVVAAFDGVPGEGGRGEVALVEGVEDAS